MELIMLLASFAGFVTIILAGFMMLKLKRENAGIKRAYDYAEKRLILKDDELREIRSEFKKYRLLHENETSYIESQIKKQNIKTQQTTIKPKEKHIKKQPTNEYVSQNNVTQSSYTESVIPFVGIVSAEYITNKMSEELTTYSGNGGTFDGGGASGSYYNDSSSSSGSSSGSSD